MSKSRNFKVFIGSRYIWCPIYGSGLSNTYFTDFRFLSNLYISHAVPELRKEIKEVISFDRVSCSASFLCTVTKQHHHHHPQFTMTGTITKCLNSQIPGLVGLYFRTKQYFYFYSNDIFKPNTVCIRINLDLNVPQIVTKLDPFWHT